MNPTDRYLRNIAAVVLTLLAVYLLAQVRGFLHDLWSLIYVVLIPFLVSLVITYLLQPVVQMLVHRRVPRGIAILIIYFTFVVGALIAILQAIPVVSFQVTQLTQHLPSLIAQADGWMTALTAHKRYLPDALRLGVESALSQLEHNAASYVANLFSMLSNTVSAIFVAFVIPFVAFYMLKDARVMGRAVVRLFPVKYRVEVKKILSGIDETLGSYVRGQLLVMLSVGILTYAGFLIIRMPYAFLLSLFLGMMDIIPYLGPFIGAAPAVILAFSVGPQMVLKVLLVNVIVQQLEGNLLSPAIMGKTLHLHPLAIVASVLIGGEMGGILGMVCAVPLLAVVKVTWTSISQYRAKVN
ncbi:AI-2E family transporter [Alicyclobacillaceae bacterium I2511]|nr:AI-2E family transporter [Alicyclobacillaceae bacterium I2511]